MSTITESDSAEDSDEDSENSDVISRSDIEDVIEDLDSLETGTQKELIAASPDDSGYDFWKVDLDSELVGNLPELVKKCLQGGGVYSDDDELSYHIEQYHPSNIGEEQLVQYVSPNKVRDEYYEQLTSTEPHQGVSTYEKNRRPSFHAIRIKEPSSDSPIIGFQQFTRRQIFGRTSFFNIHYLQGDDKYEEITDDIRGIPKRLDAIYVDGKFLCMDQRRFETIFDFMDMFHEETGDLRNNLENGPVYIDDYEVFEDAINKFPNATRKLFEISENNRYEYITPTKAETVINEFDVFSDADREDPIEFSRDNDDNLQITMSSEFNIWPVLRLLNDDHLESPLIDEARYISLGKKEID
ncbi:hypothetical protein DJ73_10355 [Halorubrum sp. Ea1]|uniref:Kiwa anti-phage protein KwaB-like domain-containing protein n=1 Tax=Halorubrum sp. Ea1 TaxID=1480718 RepID=UPI000B990581|nr:Kiwa anti-phage protein KwaB-like domain-containing protein [Halorubrum sp. Ea1]OYR52639.1 hypothetical protein DJ73_10355 [Halorubrum sp. Ea1]